MGIDSVGTRRTPERRTNLQGGAAWERLTPATVTVTSGTTPVTLTAAQLAKKLIPVDCQDTGDLTLPTATLIAAGNPGINVGDVFEFSIINYGDSTLTLVVGTGITNKVIDSEDAILAIATHIGTRYALVCTGKSEASDPSKSDTFDLYLLATSTCTS